MQQEKEAVSACSLGPEALAKRVARWKALGQGSLRSRERTATGVRLVFERSPETLRELSELSRLEQECCAVPGVSWSVREEGDALFFEIVAAGPERGTAEAKAIFDAFSSPELTSEARPSGRCC